MKKIFAIISISALMAACHSNEDKANQVSIDSTKVKDSAQQKGVTMNAVTTGEDSLTKLIPAIAKSDLLKTFPNAVDVKWSNLENVYMAECNLGKSEDKGGYVPHRSCQQ